MANRKGFRLGINGNDGSLVINITALNVRVVEVFVGHLRKTLLTPVTLDNVANDRHSDENKAAASEENTEELVPIGRL